MRFTRAAAVVMLLLASAPAPAVHVTVVVPKETPADAHIYLAGSLASVGAWRADGFELTRGDGGRCTGDVPLSPGETLAFKVTRGSWASVETRFDGSEIANRTMTADPPGEVSLIVERWADAPGGQATTRPSTLVGDLRIVVIDDGVAQRTLRIWLPPGYDADATRRYPVLYMQDGQNCFDVATSAFGHEWQIDETLTRFIADKTVEPIIVVGVDNRGERRTDDYTPTKDKNRGGDAAAYEDRLVHAIKTYVDAQFRTQPDRAHTFVGGSSLGGLVSLDTARNYPDVFGGVIAMSPSLWWDDEALTRAIEADPKALTNTRVYLDIGSKEGDEPAKMAAYVLQADRLARRLANGHVEHRLTIDPAGEHNEAAWARRFPEAIRYLLAK